MYLDFIRYKDLHKSSLPSPSHAVRSGDAAWPIYDDTLMMLRGKDIGYMGFYSKETGDLFVCHAKTFHDRLERRPIRYTRRAVLCVPLSIFQVRSGKIKV